MSVKICHGHFIIAQSGNSCYGTRSQTHLFHCTFTTFDCRFSFHIYRSYHLLCWHFSIRCMVVYSFLFPFLIADTYLPSRWRVNSFPLSYPYSMTFQHVLFPGLCAHLGHINTVPICTIYSKLVLVSLLAIYSCLSEPSSASTLPRVLVLSLDCQYDDLEASYPSLLDRLLEGSQSLREYRSSKKQEERNMSVSV